MSRRSDTVRLQQGQRKLHLEDGRIRGLKAGMVLKGHLRRGRLGIRNSTGTVERARTRPLTLSLRMPQPDAGAKGVSQQQSSIQGVGADKDSASNIAFNYARYSSSLLRVVSQHVVSFHITASNQRTMYLCGHFLLPIRRTHQALEIADLLVRWSQL